MDQMIDLMYQVAIYLRLSKDDGDFSFSGTGKTESNSIHNQRELLMAYLKKHPEMELYDEYKDDGYTGTNFDRPAFKRMLEDIRHGKVNCVIVKDLSRFGRDYIDCGKYIEKIFPQLKVRFISLNDGYDTASMGGADSIIIPFKNLINDSYSRDISIKIRSNLDVKRKQGEFVSNFAVYGYRKDPDDKNHLIIDAYAAGVVRDIFKWKIEGLSPNRIADRLNELGILSPLEYKKAKGSKFKTKFSTRSKASWSHVAVRRILQNEVYLGILVQGKRTTLNYKTKQFVQKDKSEWSRVEETHQAIIKRPQFDMVQQLLREDTRAAEKSNAVHSYCGRIFCGDCGSSMVRKTSKCGDKRYVYYVCSANKSDRTVCSKHSIREDALDAAVLATIQGFIAAILDMDRALSKIEALAWEKSSLCRMEAAIERQKEIIAKNNALRLGTYEDLQNGILTREEYLALKAEFSSRIDSAKGVIERLECEKESIRHGLTDQQGWLSQFRKYKNISEITRTEIVSLVERINVNEDSEIEVVFRQQNQVADIVAFLDEQKALKERSKVINMPKAEVI